MIAARAPSTKLARLRVALAGVLALALLVALWRAGGVAPPASGLAHTLGSRTSTSPTSALETSETSSRAPIAADTRPLQDVQAEPMAGPRDGLWLRVVDASGADVAGVALAVHEELWRTCGKEVDDEYLEEHVVTARDGRTRITARSADEIQRVILRRGDGTELECHQEFSRWPAAQDEVRFLAPQTTRVHGRVLDSDGMPAPGVHVELEPLLTAPRTIGLHEFVATYTTSETDTDGLYSIAATSGCFLVRATRYDADVPADEVRCELGGEHRDLGVDFVVPALGRELRVRVDGPAGRPPGRLDLEIEASCEPGAPSARDGAGIRHRERQIRARGPREVDREISLHIGRRGSWRVTARGERIERTTVDVPPDASDVRLLLRMRAESPGIRFAGRVVDPDGAPVSNGQLALLDMQTPVELARSATRSDGTFEIVTTRLEPASVCVFALAPKHAPARAGPFALAAPRTDVEIVLTRELAITGHVSGLTPGSRADVMAMSIVSPLAGQDGAATGSWASRTFASTDDDGAFELDGLAAGEYALWIRPRDPGLPPARARVRAGDTCDVALGSGLDGDLVLDVAVRDALTNLPIVGVDVEMVSENSIASPRGVVGRTDARGCCQLRGQPPGRWILATRANGYAFRPARATDFAESGAVDLELLPACTLDVELTTAEGVPLFGIEACVTSESGEPLDLQDARGNWAGTYARSDAAGRMELRGVPAGRVRLVVGWRDGAAIGFADDESSAALANPRGFAVFQLDARPGVREIVRRALR